MPARQYKITDPLFSEYVFYCMHTATQEQKANLNAHELSWFKTEKRIRQFAENKSTEERNLMLIKLGYQVMFVYQAYGIENTSVWEEIKDQGADAKKRMDIIKKMVADKTFVWGSPEVMLTLQMASQNSHSQVFVMDSRYRALTQKSIKLGLDSDIQDIKDAQKEYDFLSKMMLCTLCCQDECEAICGVTFFELKVLMALLPYKDTFMSAEALSDALHLEHRAKNTARVAGTLEKKGLIGRLPGFEKTHGNKKNSYVINGNGINVVFKYMKYVLKNADN